MEPNENLEQEEKSSKKKKDKLQRKEEEIESLKDINRRIDDEKEMYKSKSENYENSTIFKLMKPYWKK